MEKYSDRVGNAVNGERAFCMPICCNASAGLVQCTPLPQRQAFEMLEQRCSRVHTSKIQIEMRMNLYTKYRNRIKFSWNI